MGRQTSVSFVREVNRSGKSFPAVLSVLRKRAEATRVYRCVRPLLKRLRMDNTPRRVGARKFDSSGVAHVPRHGTRADQRLTSPCGGVRIDRDSLRRLQHARFYFTVGLDRAHVFARLSLRPRRGGKRGRRRSAASSKGCTQTQGHWSWSLEAAGGKYK